jgi:transcriptional regulator with XRE-family HTH domain
MNRGGAFLKIRKLELGDRNLIGARVTEARLAKGMKQVELLAKLQLAGVDMSVPALSLLEGQKRPVSDIELNALADILNVSVDWLLGRKESELETIYPIYF